MAGHSKWAGIKHKKAIVDARRGKLFTKLLKEIAVAARMGGGDPSGNARLRTAIQVARSANVPNDNVDRAIRRGTGELGGVNYEEVVYEGYGPGGVAILLETITDNRNRTVADIRHLLTKNGGNLGENGCVSWIFEQHGLFTISTESITEEEVMTLALEVGADDVITNEKFYELLTSPDQFNQVSEALAAADVQVESRQLARIPQNYVEVGPDKSPQLLRLMEALEDHEDVQNVWANFDLNPAAVESLAG